MKQNDENKDARVLSMEELESVAGGIRVKSGTPKKKTFEVRVK